MSHSWFMDVGRGPDGVGAAALLNVLCPPKAVGVLVYALVVLVDSFGELLLHPASDKIKADEAATAFHTGREAIAYRRNPSPKRR